MLSRLFRRKTDSQPDAGASGQPAARSLSFDWRQYVVFIAFVVVLAVFGATLYDSGFLSPNNLLNIVRQSAIIAVMAVAMTFVILAAEVDLSVGAVAGVGSVLRPPAGSRVGLFERKSPR